MSYSETMARMKSNATNGSEYNDGKKIDEHTLIGHTNCDYCNEEMIAVWDEFNKKDYWPRLGHQSRRPNTYSYSPVMNAIRKHYSAEGQVFNDDKGNNLLNVHARLHSNPTSSKRFSKTSVRLLCNKCFQKTYNRVKVIGSDGIEYALTVLPEKGETIESVMQEFQIIGKIKGKGSINDYD